MMCVLGQDVDLRSLNTTPDPRLARMADQDMRQIPGNLPNPLQPPVTERSVKLFLISTIYFVILMFFCYLCHSFSSLPKPVESKIDR